MELEQNEVAFDVMESDMDDIYRIYDFIFECRDRINESFVLIDTLNEIRYSTKESKETAANPIGNLDWVIGDITEQMYNRMYLIEN